MIRFRVDRLPALLRSPLFEREHLDLKNELRIRLDPPRGEAPAPVGVVRTAVDLRHLPKAHPEDAFVPPLDDLSQPDGEGEGLLAGVLGGPKFGGEVAIFAIAGAVDGDRLAAAGEGAISGAEDCFCEPHGVSLAGCRGRKVESKCYLRSNSPLHATHFKGIYIHRNHIICY